MSESNIMMVNPNEIVIDMPVDEQNVTQKMESMKERGIIQPVTLWLQGMRVIDGFHRSVAAQRLGWTEIPCYVVDCSEDAFWDARIQSARQHHRIENDRLLSWMLESWKTTEWYAQLDVDTELLETYKLDDKEDLSVTLSILDTLWTLYRKDGKEKIWYEDGEMSGDRRRRLTRVLKTDGNSPRKINPKLAEWIESKAHRWGIAEHDLVNKIFSFYPRLFLDTSHPFDYIARSLDELASELDSTFTERQRLVSKIDVSPRVLERGAIYDFKDWARGEAKKSADSQIRLSEYLEIKRKAEEEKRKVEAEAKKVSDIEHQRFLQTPQGQVEVHKRKVQTVKEAMDRVVWTAESVDHLISDTQDFSAPVAEAIAVLTDFHRDHFKRKDTKIKDLVIARNAQLRREIKALNDQVASLKRALEAKQVATPRLKNVMVEHAQ